MTENEYFLIFGIISFVSCLAGIAFISPFKAWTIETLIDRMENPITINKTIISLQSKKAKLILQEPALKKIPDHVQVIISPYKVNIEEMEKEKRKTK